MKHQIQRLMADEAGQELPEYAILIGSSMSEAGVGAS